MYSYKSVFHETLIKKIEKMTVHFATDTPFMGHEETKLILRDNKNLHKSVKFFHPCSKHMPGTEMLPASVVHR